MFFQTSSQDFLWMEVQEVLFFNKYNSNIMGVGDTILYDVTESSIDDNWCLVDNKSTFNALINGKYLSKIREAPDGQYLCVHYNSGVTYTNNIGDLARYSNHVWYNPKGMSNILSFGLVQKHHILTYNSQYRNGFVVNRIQQPTLKMTKAILLYHHMKHLLPKKKERAHNGELFTIPHFTSGGKEETVHRQWCK